MATPAARLLFEVFVLQSGFKGTAMQVEGHHIGGSEGTLGEVGEEEFIDDSVADEPNLPFLFDVEHEPAARTTGASDRSHCTSFVGRSFSQELAEGRVGSEGSPLSYAPNLSPLVDARAPCKKNTVGEEDTSATVSYEFATEMGNLAGGAY